MSNAAIYARVSSARQKEQQTIDSQTAALNAQAEQLGLEVPSDWEFCDDGHSGATLVRPGLEKLRDLVAQVPVETVIVYAPDRLARKYAYQALLIEEFAKHGTSVVFVKGPSSDTPEDALLVQFQGMIAEYERAQILERTRRGKSHRARQGTVNVLSGAPFGYRYLRKSEHADATYEVLPHEAAAVAEIFRRYVEDGVAIAELARWLSATEVPTRTGKTRWDRSTVWAMLRNPAYAGRACFGKTMRTSDQPGLNRTARLAGRSAPKSYSVADRDRADWVEIPVPALVTEDTWQRAQQRLADNKHFAARSSKVPSLLQGLAACSGCGYAYYRSHTTTSAGNKIYYYRCLGSDAYRYEHGAVCDTKPVRTDYLDKAVWDHIGGLLADPQLVRTEIDRRLDQLRTADPTTAQQQRLEQALAKTTAALTRLISAYQEELISLDELRERTPDLRSRERSLHTQLDAVATQLVDREAYLRLAENLETFLARLRDNTEHADTREQQRVLRLLVKEVLIGPEHITIRHCIPTRGGTTTPTMEATDEDSDKEEDRSSHLRWRSQIPPCGVPVCVASRVPMVVITPALRNALTSPSTRLSPILCRARSIKATWSIMSKHASMSASSTHLYAFDVKWWISATASCARRFGRNPYEHGSKSASKMGSITSFKAACTTRSATVGMPRLRSFPLALGIITCRTSTGLKVRSFNCSRTPHKNASTPIRWRIWATVALSTPGVRDPLFPATRSHATIKNAGS